MIKQKIVFILFIIAIVWHCFWSPSESGQKISLSYWINTLSFKERVSCQTAIEKVFWKHRISGLSKT